VSLQITQKNIQSFERIQTRTRSQRLCGGTRLRRYPHEYRHGEFVCDYTWWICVSFILTDSSGNWPIFVIFRSSDAGTWPWPVPLPPHGFSSQIKTKVDNILVETVTIRIVLNIDDTPIASKSHTHPSHFQTSRLLTSSLSSGVPVPHSTQCIRDV